MSSQTTTSTVVPPQAHAGRNRQRKDPRGEITVANLLGSKKLHYVFLVPAVAFFLAFVLYPIISVAQASIMVTDANTEGTGLLRNFAMVLKDPVFWTASKNMALWALLTISVQMIIGGGVAYLIETHAKRSKTVLRTAFLVPLVTSASVIALVWSQIYAPSYGPLAGTLEIFGISLTTSPIGDPKTAIFAIIVINIWEYTGFSMLMYIVALHRIPEELIEAAKVDGATGFRRIRSIIIPLVAPTTKSLLMLGVIGTLQTFPLVYLTTNGGPNHASEIYGTQIFREGFLLDHMGYASALSVITLIIALVATLLQMRLLGARFSMGGR